MFQRSRIPAFAIAFVSCWLFLSTRIFTVSVCFSKFSISQNSWLGFVALHGVKMSWTLTNLNFNFQLVANLSKLNFRWALLRCLALKCLGSSQNQFQKFSQRCFRFKERSKLSVRCNSALGFVQPLGVKMSWPLTNSFFIFSLQTE